MSYHKVALCLLLVLTFSCSNLEKKESIRKFSGKVIAAIGEFYIIGNIPNRYLKKSERALKGKYTLGYVKVQDQLIAEIGAFKNKRQYNKFVKSKKTSKVIFAKSSKSKKYSKTFDYLYPGLIDLHNHTKQNNLGVWDLAKGQFNNRFEWRKWSKYKYSVSGNMNPWIGYGKPIACAAFRWSEMQAMVLGTTYLQGPSSCVTNFGIARVEDPKAYISNKKKISAPTDLVLPADFTYFWEVLKPLIEAGLSYEKALAQDVNENCSLDHKFTEANVNESVSLKILADKSLLKDKCTAHHSKFIRFINWHHKTIASKKNAMKHPDYASFIVHLAEGRRDDAYNQTEFVMAKLMGFVGPRINFVHGVGITKSGLTEMGKNGMGIIWSPFSNMILYGQTLDVKTAKTAGVNLALGSDWLPTGTRSVLDELKVAYKYVLADVNKVGLKKIINDEDLYLMVNENPAKMIGHFEVNPAKGEHGIGQLKVGAMASIIAVKKYSENPYKNLVRYAFEKDINLVVVNGEPMYGSKSYISQLGFNSGDYEVLPNHLPGLNNIVNSDYPKPDSLKPSSSEKKEILEDLAIYVQDYIKANNITVKNTCKFTEDKVFIHQSSINDSKELVDFFEKTGINLDRAHDIYNLVAINMLTQSRNLHDPSKGKPEYAVTKFPSLYSCNQPSYVKRVYDFIKPYANTDEFREIRTKKARALRRSTLGGAAASDNMAAKYPN
jgi:cytosine/adenosine deaminase-related metal-dependent hydrolase